MESTASTVVERSVENPRARWARETKEAIEFEEDPHKAALEDDPELVYVGPRAWAAIFALSISLGAPIGLALLSTASVSTEITRELDASSFQPWVVGCWSIANACSAAVAGYLSDIFGRRNIIIIGDLIVLLGTIMGGTARSIELLLLAQTLIGLGAGFLFDAFAAVPEMLPNKWRVLGAGIVEGGINVPWPKGDFHKTRWQQIKELDYIGIVSVTGGIALFTSGLTWGGLLFPWDHPGTILTITLGFFTIIGGFAYDWSLAKNPMVPLNLFWPKMFRRYSAILVVLFVSGMNFYAMTTLLPLGANLMFTTDGLEIGLMSLPKTVMELIVGFFMPLVSHKIPEYIPGFTIKWQLVVGMVLQAVFLAASAASVNPNNKFAYMFLPAFGVPMFTWVTVLSYAIASLHVPHSQLATALGLLGTFRSTGGAIGNAFFGALFTSLSARETSRMVQAACESLDVCPTTTIFNQLLADLTAYNQGVPGMMADVSPEARDILVQALHVGYGRSFQIVFCATIPLSVIAVLCSWYIEDPWPYMNNHVQFRMYERGGFSLRSPEEPSLTGATVVWPATKKMNYDSGIYGIHLERVPSQASQACLTTRTSMILEDATTHSRSSDH
ncbi:hypothetical protein N0V93_002692 [Gnomoniopsis smithogilvyi]|uniref:Major facilitator superfamily (MFS) profile domain-containing protein n=1 Tax=Gnomoniopsis smithogilvyi TaxID=1191159 RepID=A0A9W8YV93_9PEZI|nr:hypothetical protein N0V93_002692 [Gnomoniopsis smithogilvyi]